MFRDLKFSLEREAWDFGDAVSRLRADRGLTLEVLAPKLSMSRAHLSRLEHGEAAPHLRTIDILEALRTALNPTHDEFAELIAAYTQVWLNHVELIHRSRKSQPYKDDSLNVPIAAMVDLWTLSNELLSDFSQTTGQLVSGAFQRALALTKSKTILFSDPLGDDEISTGVDRIVAKIRRQFNVVLALSPAIALDKMAECWVYVLVASESTVRSQEWGEVMQRASWLRVPVVWLSTDELTLAETGRYEPYRNIAIGEVSDKLLGDLEDLTEPKGQTGWWISSSVAESGAEQDHAEGKRPNTEGIPPQGLGSFFVGREEEIRQIIDILLSPDSDKRAVNIYGWHTGKTALACQVMNQLSERADGVYGLVYLSHPISLEVLYMRVARMLGTRAEKALKRWLDFGIRPVDRGQFLLEQIGSNRCIILLDGLDNQLDQDGQIRDVELRDFVNSFLRQEHGGRLLITSSQTLRVDAEVAHHLRIFPLTTGLSTSEGVDLLLNRDENRVLANTDTSVLEDIVKKATGLPIALLKIYELMVDPIDPVTPENLLLDDTLFYGTLVENLVKEAQSRLSADSQRVMQVFAVLVRLNPHPPLTREFADFMLAGYLPPEQIKIAIDQLIRLGYIEWDRQIGQFEIHNWDQTFYYAAISIDTNDDYNLYELEQRTAQYYADRVPIEENDLLLRLTELDHWIRSRGYANALALLDNLSADPLNRWDHDHLMQQGYFNEIIRIRQVLAAGLTPECATRNAANLARVYMNGGQYVEASAYFEEAQRGAQDLEDTYLKCLCLIGLGHCQRGQQDYGPAIASYQRALSLLHPASDLYMCATSLDGIACALRDQGDLQKALDYSQQALDIASEMEQTIGLFMKATCRETQARIYRHRVLVREAIKEYEAILEIQKELKDRRAQLYVLSRLGIVSQDIGRAADEEEYQRQALKIANEVGDLRGKSKILERLANLYVAIGKYDDALDNAGSALAIATSINARRTMGYCHLRFGQIHLANNNYEQAASEFGEAEQLFDTIATLFDQQDCKNQLARLYLITDDPSRAWQKIHEALACNTEFHNHHSLLLKAILTIYRGEDEPDQQAAFGLALDSAERILEKTPHFYPARFTRGLALAGLALLSHMKGENKAVRTAYIACSDILQYEAFKGAINEVVRTLRLVREFDKDNVLLPCENLLLENATQ